MTVASEITRIKTNIANAYNSASEKGATLPAVQNSDNLATCISSITGGGNSSKYSISIDNILGDVDENGVLQLPSDSFNAVFNGVKDVAQYGLYYRLRNILTIETVSFPDLEKVSNNNACVSLFENASGLKFVDLHKLTKITGSQSCYSMFRGAGVESFDLSNLTEVSGYGGASNLFSSCKVKFVDLHNLTKITGNTACSGMFSKCDQLESVDLSNLTTKYYKGCENMFNGCTKLSSISFPALTTVTGAPFGTSTSHYIFGKCTALTEIHFRADMQTTIEALTSYTDKWGATNATIYFDL